MLHGALIGHRREMFSPPLPHVWASRFHMIFDEQLDCRKTRAISERYSFMRNSKC